MGQENVEVPIRAWRDARVRSLGLILEFVRGGRALRLLLREGAPEVGMHIVARAAPGYPVRHGRGRIHKVELGPDRTATVWLDEVILAMTDRDEILVIEDE